PTAIDLGLERVAAVAARLGVTVPRARVITVAGTNGKGSVCGLLEAMLRAAGYPAGVYTSPHLLRFNERIRIAGREADDPDLCAAFERVEAARGDTTLTYFEFGTLAAFDLFNRAGADPWVLEVGLGGRLDATNAVDADVAVVTSVGLDHVEWLGADRDRIGREKAGIGRRARPLVVGDPEPPAGLLEAATELGAVVGRLGDDFDYTLAGDRWDWVGPDAALAGLPLPALAGGYQVRNAATALAALRGCGLDLPRAAIEAGLSAAVVPGRFQVHAGAVETILDVAHNPDAAAMLAVTLHERPCAGRTLAVIAMYGDKDAAGVIARLAPAVDGWCVAGLAGPRAREADTLARIVEAHGLDLWLQAPDPVRAWRDARGLARPGDRLVVLGSFATVAAVAPLLAAEA
ncbi:MAG: bifunctional tetrahydrofolate synthase/dihydrofolate synthase, partial [Halofilum sp. (in: g-proteobacteria)]|nr:bifunctional tetrahydrofolate synthase/dihydrofolate synthase [Halofilum sp. (in: g-proteobacteria)]